MLQLDFENRIRPYVSEIQFHQIGSMEMRQTNKNRPMPSSTINNEHKLVAMWITISNLDWKQKQKQHKKKHTQKPLKINVFFLRRKYFETIKYWMQSK